MFMRSKRTLESREVIIATMNGLDSGIVPKVAPFSALAIRP